MGRRFPKTHGHSGSPYIRKASKTYRAWQNAKARCLNQNNPYFEKYGGRGIGFCERWLKFENFLSDMGECPQGLSLDRINNDLGYSPENCRWVSQRIQMGNTRKTIRLQFRGVSLCLADVARFAGLHKTTVYTWHYRGDDVVEKVESYLRQAGA